MNECGARQNRKGDRDETFSACSKSGRLQPGRSDTPRAFSTVQRRIVRAVLRQAFPYRQDRKQPRELWEDPMIDYQNILAYIDERPESHAALAQAAHLGSYPGVRTSLIDVIEALSDLTPWPNGEDFEALRSLLIESRKEVLRLQGAHAGVKAAQISVAIGKASFEITRQVLRDDHDLVIKTAQGKKDGRRVSFGSLGMHLVRKCPAPVWLVQPGENTCPRRILAAVNPVGAGRQQMCRKILDHANALAGKWNAQLHVLHSWSTSAEAMLRDRVTSATVARYVASTHETAAEALTTLIEERCAGLPNSRVHLTMGSPVESIASVVRDVDIDVVVLGAVGSNARAGHLIGSVTEEVMNRVDCGVFCIKPDNFVCPIQFN